MNNYDFFATRFEMEIPAFGRVLRALPGDRLDYRPHERSTPAGALAWQIATEAEGLATLFDNGVIDYNVQPAPATVEEIASAFERSARTVVQRARTTTDELWTGPGRFLYNGQPVWEAPAADLAWGFLFDLVHHRGQLSAYLRPMGGKVPSIYGPSGDDTGGA